MSLLSHLRSPALSFVQTLLSLLLSLFSLSSSHWFVGSQKVPKPLCSPTRRLRCTPVPGMTDSSAQFSWETGDDRFIFPTFHTGLWTTCEENIYTDAWEEKCRSFMALTPASEKGILWLCVGMELLYIVLLSVSSVLLLLQLSLSLWCPLQQSWGHLLNAFAAVCTVLGGCSVAWLAFTCCMSSGVSTLNIYTKTFLMLGRKHQRVFYPCKNFTFPPQCPLVSPLSPYVSPPLPPPPPTCPAPLSPALSLLRPPVILLLSPVGSDEDFSPL
ncbi:putative germ cell-specific gene 1-like protein-like protein [Triplophysa rosa]|uniref:Germ cell-specific gene 1-like protein-like protein n=1 Tax=Triplophysa rosa TaxID=992332 RepID=A0A9W7T5Q9_TRIRA|nr:putative germ cell-specific gene 1-like protein-like protein [Triplophysa rosa]